MKKLIIIVLILLGVIVVFLGGMKREKFNYIDVCLDMGGGMNPGNYEICVIDNTEPNVNLGGGIDPDFLNIAVCTDDAKQCPDGSYVGREGKNCEFTKCPGKILPHLDPDYISPTGIQLPENVISEKDCAAAGGEVWNTLGETSYDGELIGRVEGLRCPCACLIRAPESDILWVDINGNIEEFAGNIDDIKTYNDCKNAGFAVKDNEPEICTVGEPHMISGKYKTFYNNSIEDGKVCTDYTYSTCPGSCVANCRSSHCSEPDENGAVMCTSDCDGAGSCIELGLE